MGYNTESMIKSAITETIAEELFRELGFYVMKLGQENILTPITQLERFIYKCNGYFKIKESKKNCISSIDYVRKLPDFLIVYKNGDVIFLEVKYRYDGIYDPGNIFDIFPLTKVLVISKITEDYETDDAKESIKTRFCIYESDESSEESVGYNYMSLAEWLKKNNFDDCNHPRPNITLGNELESIIRKYNDLIIKCMLDIKN